MPRDYEQVQTSYMWKSRELVFSGEEEKNEAYAAEYSISIWRASKHWNDCLREVVELILSCLCFTGWGLGLQGLDAGPLTGTSNPFMSVVLKQNLKM